MAEACMGLCPRVCFCLKQPSLPPLTLRSMLPKSLSAATLDLAPSSGLLLSLAILDCGLLRSRNLALCGSQFKKRKAAPSSSQPTSPTPLFFFFLFRLASFSTSHLPLWSEIVPLTHLSPTGSMVHQADTLPSNVFRGHSAS